MKIKRAVWGVIGAGVIAILAFAYACRDKDEYVPPEPTAVETEVAPIEAMPVEVDSVAADSVEAM